MKREWFLGAGKLNYKLLEELLREYKGVEDERVVVGPGIGEDAAVIDFGNKYLVTKTDPIVCVQEQIGYYAPIINANDIATTGAVPKWFMATVLLPRDAREQLAREIFEQMDVCCKTLGLALVSGHTEISFDLERPIVVGSMFGEMEKEKLVRKSAKVGDSVLLVKGIAIEGTSIIVREKAEEVLARYGKEFLARCKNFIYEPGISVVREALIARDFATSMHDPTEGGLFTGLYEVAKASGKGILVYKNKIHVYPETETLCKDYDLSPYSIFASGALIVTTPREGTAELIRRYNSEGIKAIEIGEIRDKEKGLKVIDIKGRESDLVYYEKDELIRKIL
jgi:hydrogenase expression/formation protein HypE